MVRYSKMCFIVLVPAFWLARSRDSASMINDRSSRSSFSIDDPLSGRRFSLNKSGMFKKCIGYNSHENFISKGEIVIVAIPKVNGEKQFYEPK